MNRKQLALLVVLLVILGGAVLFIQNGRNKNSDGGTAGTGQKILGENFPYNDVTHIVIKGATNELNLTKKDTAWVVRERGDYPASFPQISDFLIKASELKVVQSEEIGASQLPRMQLVAPGQGAGSGVLLDLKGKDDKTIKSVLLGKRHSRKPAGGQMEGFGDEGTPDGRYVMLENNKNHALLVNDPLSNVEPKPEVWLNKDFFKVERPKAISVAFPAAATNSWMLTRESESGEWKLSEATKDEKLDTGKISGLTSPFASPTFDDVVPPAGKPEEFGLDKPTTITVVTFDNFIYAVKIGKKSGEDYPVTISISANIPKERVPMKGEKPDDKKKADELWPAQQKQFEDRLKREKRFENWIYLMPAWSIDQLLKERKDLMADKKDDKSPAVDDKKDAPLDLPTTPVPDK